MSYIERKQFLKKCADTFGKAGVTIKAIEGIVDKCTTADVVEVVRCKDCKWCEDLLMSGLYCNHPDNRNPIHCLPDDFCNCGERREE